MKVSTLVAAAPVVAYAWVAGGSPSTQRAEIMVLAYLLLLFLGRPREVWSALALAALAILAFTPLRLYAISFQLSFVAVAALIYFLPRWFLGARGGAAFRRVAAQMGTSASGSGAGEAAAASLVATLATAPLVAAYFQVVSILGVAVNLAAIPLVLLLALPLGEAAVLAQALSPHPGGPRAPGPGANPLVAGVCGHCLGGPTAGERHHVPTPTWLQIAAYFLLLAPAFAAPAQLAGPGRGRSGRGGPGGLGGPAPVSASPRSWR